MAFKVGRSPEKAMASTLLAMLLIDELNHFFFGPLVRLDTVDPAHFLIDTASCIVMVAVALKANRMYTLWMAGFQIIAFFAHLARELADAISPITYAMMYIGPSYFQISLLGCGIWLHHRRQKRYGNYRSWRSLPEASSGAPSSGHHLLSLERKFSSKNLNN